ncbi:MAG: hypothetical protein JWO38_2534, partial [Gemmataceae bacterium]|nr:hypothetical protein [Gemmataceae bacterium]
MVFSRSYWLKIAFPTKYFEKTRC